MKQRNWRQHLQKARTRARFAASWEATRIAARLQVQLSPEAWEEIEENWEQGAASETYLPEQRRDYLLKAACQHNISLAGI
jgi:hypothetical protein